MSLYLKYRPSQLNELIGNTDIRSALENALKTPEKSPHAFLLHGPKGCGKTTTARIIANQLGVKGGDLRELDSADFRGIDVIREIRKQAQFRPMEGPRRMWILDEVHQTTKDAQSALLKILEDTPKHVYFALCTTDPQKLLPTVRDRCTQLNVGPLVPRDMASLLKRVVKAEGERLDKNTYKRIIKESDGHPRAALQMLDLVLRVPEERRAEIVLQIAEEQTQSIELCRALLSHKGWKFVSNILNGLKGQDAESIRRHVLGYAQSVLLKEDNELAARVIEEFYEPLYDIGFPGLVYACYAVVKN